MESDPVDYAADFGWRSDGSNNRDWLSRIRFRAANLCSKSRSPTRWAAVIIAVSAFAGIVCLVGSWVVFPLWLAHNPGSAIGHFLLGTPLHAYAAVLHAFVVGYYPDCVALLCAGIGIAWMIGRRWKPIAVIFLIAFMVINHVAGVAVHLQLIGHLRGGDLRGSLIWGAFTLFTFAHLWLGAWLGTRLGPPHPGA